jgi:hypothetical protein
LRGSFLPFREAAVFLAVFRGVIHG